MFRQILSPGSVTLSANGIDRRECFHGLHRSKPVSYGNYPSFLRSILFALWERPPGIGGLPEKSSSITGGVKSGRKGKLGAGVFAVAPKQPEKAE